MKRYLAIAMFVACSVAAVVIAACSKSPAAADAAIHNAPFGAKCTMVVDSGSTECASGTCTNSFNMLTYDVCSQLCTMFMMMDPSCPVGSNGMRFCNMKGYCKP
jgi:hypothetical protein